MSRRDFFEFNTPVKTNDDVKTQTIKLPRGMGKGKVIEPNSETAHELNKLDLAWAVEALEHIVKTSSDKDAVHVAEVALDKISLGDFDEGKQFPYLVLHMMKHEQSVKKDDGVWTKPTVTLASNTYNCKYNGDDKIYRLYYNNFTSQWTFTDTSSQSEIPLTTPDLIQIN